MKAKPRKSESNSHLERLKIIKESISISWNLALVLFVALMLIIPEWFGSFLSDRISKAKIKGFTVAGVQFEGYLEQERGYEKATEQLKKAVEAIDELENERNIFIQSLTDAHKKTTDDNFKLNIENLRSRIETSSGDISKLQKSLTQTIENSQDLLKAEPLKGKSRSLENQAYCYQEDRLKEGAERFSVHCHASKAVCEEARGPSKVRKQTQCELTDLSSADWNPISPGWMGSSYQYSSTPFGAPFPQLQ